MLSDFDQAKHRLIAAQRIEPENTAIADELKKVCKHKMILIRHTDLSCSLSRLC
jgi:hypothetical protein